MKAILSFPKGSAGGPDGLRPQHVYDLVKCADAGPALLSAITRFVNMLLRGQCAREATPIIFGANLTALVKKSGGIRPIAVGYYWRRLSAKCANFFASTKLAAYFSPIQLGVGVSGGCEAAVHACRRYIDVMPDDNVIVKLDFSNAFNCLHRDTMLSAIQSHVPEIYAFCFLAYNDNTLLKFGNRVISSEEGIQQGDPLGPLIFCLTIHPLLETLTSEFIVGYMDDITIGSLRETIINDVNRIKVFGADNGLHINIDKCECIAKSQMSCELLESFVHVDVNDATLLGAPLSTGAAMDVALEKRHRELSKACGRLRLLSAHDALLLLKASCEAPRLIHIICYAVLHALITLSFHLLT